MNATVPPLSMATIRFLLGTVPAVVTVVFAGVIALLALLLDQQRRDYALQVASHFVTAATVLVCGLGLDPTRQVHPIEVDREGTY